jgi:SAM-dependent methyltransferase
MKYDESWKDYWARYLSSRSLRAKLWSDPGVKADYSVIKRYFHNFQDRLVLDAGCGAGRVSALLAKEGARTVCVDIMVDACKLTKRIYDDLSTETDVVVSDIRFLPFRESIFDIVYSGGVIEHIPRPEEALREIARVAKSYIIVSVPNIFSFHFIYQRIMYKLGFSHFETFFSVKRLIKLANTYGLNVINIHQSREDMGLPYFLNFSALTLFKKIGVEKYVKKMLIALTKIFPFFRLGYAFLTLVCEKR